MTLEKRFQRLGADVKPVADDEIYEVVRARLFESIDAVQAGSLPPDFWYPRKVAHVYQGMYAAHAGEVPSEAAKNTYRELIERAYPFHPLLIDALYTRWGSHPDFQRTRGVLRLLASIVGDLWKRRRASTETQHLIQPCHIRWSVDALQAALTRLSGPPYQSVAAADIMGERSNAGIFDEERGGDYRRESIGRGLASAILLGSFGGQGGRSGFSSKDLPAASRDAAQAGKGALAGATWRVIVNPAEDLPEQKSLTLLVLPPSLAWDLPDRQAGENGGAKDLPAPQSGVARLRAARGQARQAGAIQDRVKAISTRCGGKDRLYRNTLLFLVGTARGLSKLRQAHRERAALEGVRTDYWDQLDEEQREDLERRLDAARKAALEALGPAYTVALRVRGQEVESCALSDARRTFQEHLGYVWTTLVEDEEWILRRVGSVTLASTGLIPKEGGLRLKDAVEAFLRFTDKPMVAAKEAVTAGLAQACVDGLVGVGRGGSLSTLQTRYCNKSVSLDPSEDGVWIIPPFTPEPAKAPGGEESAGAGVGAGESGVGGGTGSGTTPSDSSGTATATKPGAKCTVRRFVVRGDVPVENWGELCRCFVGPAARMNLKKLGLGVQFEMVLPDDRTLSENDPALKAMKEAARQLGLTFQIEE